MELCMSAYALAASGDKRDRKAEIEEMLLRQGVCMLGSGEFYVSGENKQRRGDAPRRRYPCPHAFGG